jgi:hypothetical protein
VTNLSDFLSTSYTGFVGSTGFTGSVGFTGSQGTAAATGGSTDKIFYLNDKIITTNYSVPSNQNAMTAGPIEINSGITVTVPDGARWAIL